MFEKMGFAPKILGAGIVIVASLTIAGCSSTSRNAAAAAPATPYNASYKIGPGDSLDIFVWHNPELSVKAPVRPDGKLSIPLVEDVDCEGKTPTQLARTIEQRLKTYVNDPVVTVIVEDFNGPYADQIRVVGEASKPHAIAYRQDMTILDAMIDVGGLTPYAAGNRTELVRNEGGKQESLNVKLDDLLKDGDVQANVALRPGDIIIIPQSYF